MSMHGETVRNAPGAVTGNGHGPGAAPAGTRSKARNTFRQIPMLLPDDLADYVSKRSRTIDGQPDPKLAYAFALMSGWTYARHEDMVKQLRYQQISADVTYIACTNDAMLIVATSYFLRSKCGRLGVLSFRGTEPLNLINWLTDTNSALGNFPYGRGRIHGGFYANTQVLWDDIGEVLEAAAANRKPQDVVLPILPEGAGKYDHPMESLYITGHSLGAAMAVVAAASLLLEPGPRDWATILRGVYTFGQPMVGDADFVAGCRPRLHDKLFRYVFNDDLVPRMPPRTVKSFVHFGQRLYSPSTLVPWRDVPRLDQAPTLLETIGSATTSFVLRRVGYGQIIERILPLPYSLDDHSPTNYIQVCRASLVG